MLVAFCGYKQSGKDTAADYLVRKGFVKMSFASPLKQGVEKLFGLTREQLYGSKKEIVDERYGVTSQIRRAVVSIPSNIAEDYGRKTTPDYLRSLYIAYGSCCELETQKLLSGDLNYY